ncbi:MAG: hypothetical protein K6G63_02690 [Eubacterium sp.]|nr:hypothetical protein [Eubacterium sp.]
MKKSRLALMICTFGAICSIALATQSADAKVRINKKAVKLSVGRSVKLKLRGTKKKAKWSSSKKSVAKVYSSGKVVAKKAGTAKIYAKVGSKKYTCKITVTSSGKRGSVKNPISAYAKNTITYYNGPTKIGKFQIQLLDFKSGSKANELVAKQASNPKPTMNQEYLYFKFKIKYISGSQVTPAKELFDYYHNIFNSSGTTSVTNIDWGFFFDTTEDLSNVKLAPNNTIECSKAILVNKGYTPVIYRIPTGPTSYTWFTTSK